MVVMVLMVLIVLLRYLVVLIGLQPRNEKVIVKWLHKDAHYLEVKPELNQNAIVA